MYQKELLRFLFLKKRQCEGVKGRVLRSEQRHERQIEGEPAGWDKGEFLDYYRQFGWDLNTYWFESAWKKISSLLLLKK